MDEQEFLHKLSVRTNVNLELLRDIYHDEKFLGMVRAKKPMDASAYLRANSPVGLWEAKTIVEAFAEEFK